MVRHIHIIVMLVCMASTAAAKTSLDVLDANRLNTDGSPAAWVLKVKSGAPQVIRTLDNGAPGVCLSSRDSSFSIQRDLALDIAKYPYVTFRWRADMLPARGDLRNSSTDDQAAQMVVAFEGKRALDYIWDTNAPLDTTGEFSIPFIVTAKILVVANKQNKLHEWVDVTRDLRADYRRLYGKDPGNIVGARFQVNSQHTESSAEGCIERITFHD